MKRVLQKSLFAIGIFFSLCAAAQSPVPFTGCPLTAVAVVRPGTNTYNNDPVSIYTINTASGAASQLPGGPIKDPANPANNMDVNAAGLNSADGFLYAMSTATATTQKFYRIGSNYAAQQLGVIPAPAASFPNVGVVNAAAGEFDGSGNYYFTGATGNIISGAITTFYIGKLSNVAGLAPGTGTLAVTYTALNLSGVNCSEYLSSISAFSGASSNTGLRDLAYNARDGQIYTYASFEYPAGSGVFKGQMLKLNPTTGVVTCYPSSVLPFASATNEVAGVMYTAAGDLEVLFTNGDFYKADVSAPGIYTGSISLLGASGITPGIRGDLASCSGASGGLVPVNFESVTATENSCKINVEWKVAQEQNVQHYDVEVMDYTGRFAAAAQVNATNTAISHTYRTAVAATAKTMSIRIKQTDNDGSFTYSDVVRVNTVCERTKSITVLNSASVNDNLSIRWNNISNTENYSIIIYNAYGAEIMRKNAAVNVSGTVTTLNTEKLASGAYLIKAVSAIGEKFTERFIKK